MYGEWLILSSIPAYLTMADLGVGSAAGNEMTMRAGARDLAGAQQTYRGAMLVALGAGLIVLLLGMALSQLPGAIGSDNNREISVQQASWLITLLALGVSLGFLGGVVNAGFRAAGRNALGISLSNISRLLEAAGMATCLLLDQGPIVLCVTTLVIKALALLVQRVWLGLVFPELFQPRMPADTALIKRLIVPSLGFMAFPLGNALALQAPILIIGHTLGGPAVAMFSAMRTLARIPVQIVNALNSSVWPEMSRAHGAADTPLLRTLHRNTWGLTVALVGICGIGLMVLGPWIAQLWLRSTVVFDPIVLLALVLVSVVSATWNASSVVLAAINAHAGLGVRYVLVNALCMAGAWLTTPWLDWAGLLPWMIVAEVILLAWIWPQVMALTQDTPRAFLQGATTGLFRAVVSRLKRST